MARKYDIIVHGEIKVLVYKQDYLRDGSLPPLYSYQKPSHCGKLYDDLFSIHTSGNYQYNVIALYGRAYKTIVNSILRQCCKIWRIRDLDASKNSKNKTQCCAPAHNNEGICVSRVNWYGWFPINYRHSVLKTYELSISWDKTYDL